MAVVDREVDRGAGRAPEQCRSGRVHLGHDIPAAVPGQQPTALAQTIATALDALGDLSDLHPAVRDGRVVHWLRCAINTPAPSVNQANVAVTAVRAACAHLTAGELDDAYLALLTARDLCDLPHRAI